MSRSRSNPLILRSAKHTSDIEHPLPASAHPPHFSQNNVKRWRGHDSSCSGKARPARLPPEIAAGDEAVGCEPLAGNFGCHRHLVLE